MGAGKSTVAKYITSKYGGTSFRFSTILRDILDRLHLEHTRANLQDLSTNLRQAFGQDVLSVVMARDIQNSDADIIFIDGVRRMGDIEHIKKLEGFKLVYLEAPIELRLKRINGRGENVDDKDKTLAQLKEDLKNEAESVISQLRDHANHIIDNSGTLEQLHAQIDEILK